MAANRVTMRQNKSFQHGKVLHHFPHHQLEVLNVLSLLASKYIYISMKPRIRDDLNVDWARCHTWWRHHRGSSTLDFYLWSSCFRLMFARSRWKCLKISLSLFPSSLNINIETLKLTLNINEHLPPFTWKSRQIIKDQWSGAGKSSRRILSSAHPDSSSSEQNKNTPLMWYLWKWT